MPARHQLDPIRGLLHHSMHSIWTPAIPQRSDVPAKDILVDTVAF